MKTFELIFEEIHYCYSAAVYTHGYDDKRWSSDATALPRTKVIVYGMDRSLRIRDPLQLKSYTDSEYQLYLLIKYRLFN